MTRETVRSHLRSVRNRARALFYTGAGRFCPVCGRTSRKFRRFGLTPRDDAQCAQCGALERHRLLWLYVTRRTNLFDGSPKKMLHVAPEACLAPRFRQQLRDGYLTADLTDPGAMVRMDITDIQYPDRSFDVVYCSHVLEHVPDDRKALREFHRILADDGWAIFLVPVTVGKTIENPSITDPNERLRMFGQEDHVRAYGPDYVERLIDAGFDVLVTGPGDLVERDDAVTMGLTQASGEIYFCTKRKR